MHANRSTHLHALSPGLPPSPPGFDTGYTPPLVVLGSLCVDCGSEASTVATFTGTGICGDCDQARGRVAALLAEIVAGATPEDLLAPMFGRCLDELERRELRDHADVLLSAHHAPLEATR